jgi:phenylalanyl-tRNA synthetase beta subunit
VGLCPAPTWHAATRFEKGVDVDGTVKVLLRAAKMIQDIAGGEVVTQKQVNEAINVLKQARKNKNEKEEKDGIDQVLYKENFI